MNKEITIKTLSDDLGISKPTISKKIKELGIQPKMILQKYVLTEEEAETIRKSILGIEEETESPKKPQTETEKTANNAANTEKSETQKSENSEISPQIIEILQTSISLLQRQLEIKDKQIESLTAQIETLTMLLNQQQQLSALDKVKSIPQNTEAEEAKPKEAEAENKKKRSFFGLFR